MVLIGKKDELMLPSRKQEVTELNLIIDLLRWSIKITCYIRQKYFNDKIVGIEYFDKT